MAAISLARRIGEEVNLELSQNSLPIPVALQNLWQDNPQKFVGYKIRFDDKVAANTVVKIMTDGILMAETVSDKLLQKYQAVIIDEAHERNINIDFLLGFIKQLIYPDNEKCGKSSKALRPDLRVIITSATMDADKLAKFFYNAPIFNIAGRTYPVEIFYRPIEDFIEKQKEKNNEINYREDEDKKQAWREDKYEEILPKAIGAAINELWNGSAEINSNSIGDVLVFLPGEAEIREVRGFLQNYINNILHLGSERIEVLALYSRLTSNEQMYIFNPPENKIRIILSTNIAETSLTVPRIKYVIDTGLARIMRYSPRQKINRLEIEPIAQDSAKQRAGRCGRLSDGICIRLYSQTDFNLRPLQTSPEISRSSLALVILRMLEMNLGDINSFPWLDHPSTRVIHQGFNELTQLSAISNNTLTAIGKQMARMPIDHTLSRILIEADKLGVLPPLLIIVSAMSTREVREIPQAQAETARNLHRQYIHPDSDFLSLITLWSKVEKARAESVTPSAFRKWCKKNFLSWIRLKEWRELHLQLQSICKNIFTPSPKKADEKAVTQLEINNPIIQSAIHQALLVGMPTNIGRRHNSENYYLGANSIKFVTDRLWANKKAKWVLIGEIVATEKNTLPFARKIAKIDEQLIFSALAQFLEYKDLELSWENNLGKVMIYRQVSVYGLIISARKPMNYIPQNTEEFALAQKVFIDEALVAQKLLNSPLINSYPQLQKILHANSQNINTLIEKENRLRRPQSLYSDEILFNFYQKILPKNIYSFAELKKYLSLDNAKLDKLIINIEQWLSKKTTWQAEKYPGELYCNGICYRLTYTFAPGDNDDGITITAPLSLLPMLNENSLQWLVPGMLAEKVSAVIRTLPKSLRFKLRAPEISDKFVESILSEDFPPKHSLYQSLAIYCSKIVSEQISHNLFREENIPKHLIAQIKVVRADNSVICKTRNFSEIIKLINTNINPIEKSQAESWQNINNQQYQILREVVTWDFGQLPQKQKIKVGGQEVDGQVVLMVREHKIYLSVMVNPTLAESEHLQGLLALCKKPLAIQINNFLKHPPKLISFAHGLSWFGDEACLQKTIVNQAICKCLQTYKLPENAQEFDKTIKDCKSRFLLITTSLCELLARISDKYKEINLLIQNPKANSYIKILAVDLQKYLQILTPKNFFEDIEFERLQHYPRYFDAILRRIEKYPKNPERDKKNAMNINNFYSLIKKLYQQNQINLSQYQTLLFYLNELFVSLFAEELKTALPMSSKRLEKLINDSIH